MLRGAVGRGIMSIRRSCELQRQARAGEKSEKRETSEIQRTRSAARGRLSQITIYPVRENEAEITVGCEWLSQSEQRVPARVQRKADDRKAQTSAGGASGVVRVKAVKKM